MRYALTLWSWLTYFLPSRRRQRMEERCYRAVERTPCGLFKQEDLDSPKVIVREDAGFGGEW
jgi:hypothetical protein